MNYLNILIDTSGNDIGKLIHEYLCINNTEINIINSSKRMYVEWYEYKIRLKTNVISITLDFMYDLPFKNCYSDIYYHVDDYDIKIDPKIHSIINEMIHLHYLENYAK